MTVKCLWDDLAFVDHSDEEIPSDLRVVFLNAQGFAVGVRLVIGLLLDEDLQAVTRRKHR